MAQPPRMPTCPQRNGCPTSLAYCLCAAGVSARRRKQELERLNEQLRTINTQLRQQARAGTLYAPGLTYAPTNVAAPSGTTFGGNGAAAAVAELAARVAPMMPAAAPAEPAAAAASSTPAVSLMSQDDEEAGPEAAQCTQVGGGERGGTGQGAAPPDGCWEREARAGGMRWARVTAPNPRRRPQQPIVPLVGLVRTFEVWPVHML